MVFIADDQVGPRERGVDVVDEEWERVEEAANEGHPAGDQAAEDGIATSGEFAVVGEALGEGHRDASTHSGGRADEKDCMRVARGKGGREDGGQRGDGTVHQAGEAGLDDAEEKVTVVPGECFEVIQDFSHGSMMHQPPSQKVSNPMFDAMEQRRTWGSLFGFAG